MKILYPGIHQNYRACAAPEALCELKLCKYVIIDDESSQESLGLASLVFLQQRALNCKSSSNILKLKP
eukprot:954093-Pleurochrysis_carterae.AAC.1